MRYPGNHRRIYLLAAAVVATNAAGNALLRVGLSDLPPLISFSPLAYLAAFANAAVLIGVVALLAGFIFELTLLSWADLTFVLPITSSSYVLIAVIGVFCLHESVSLAHWGGVVLILFGVIVVGRTRPLTPGSGFKL